MNPTPWLIAVDDPTASTLLTSVFSESSAPDPELVRRDGRTRLLRFLQRNDQTTGVLYDDVGYNASSVVEVAIGASNNPPTSGTFQLSFDSDSTGLTALAFNITEGNLQTALNANPTISAAGGVTVAKGAFNGAYLIQFNNAGARNLLVGDIGTLSPPSRIFVERVQVGDVDTKEVQNLTFAQQYYAYSDDFTAASTGSVTVTETQAGSATVPSIQTVSISSNVIGGTFTLQLSQAQIMRLVCQNNVAVRQSFSIAFDSAVSGLNNDFIDIFDVNGAVRIWFDLNSTGSAPPTPTGGRLVEVDSATDDAAGWSAGLAAAFAADAGLDLIGTAGGIGYGHTLATKTLVSVSSGTAYSVSGVTVTNNPVNFGRLDQQAFLMYDADGLVGVWLNLSSSNSVPSTLASASRLLVVTSIAGTASGHTFTSTPTQVASAINTIVDADASFASTASGGEVTITQAAVGPREEPATLTALLGISQTKPGISLAGSFYYGASAGDIEAIFGDYFRVTQKAEHAWQLVAIDVGAMSVATASSTNLTFAPVWEGELVINSWNLALAFQATTNDEITSTLEIQVTEPGADPVKVLSIPITIRRDVIDSDSLSNPTTGGSSTGNIAFFGGVTAYTGGATSALDGQTTTNLSVPRLAFFVHSTDGLRGYMLRAGTDAESSPAIIRPDDYNGSTNAKVWQSVS